MSRALKDPSIEYDAQAVIVGTYAVVANNVYVTTKLIRASESVVLVFWDSAFPHRPDMKKLVETEKGKD